MASFQSDVVSPHQMLSSSVTPSLNCALYDWYIHTGLVNFFLDPFDADLSFSKWLEYMICTQRVIGSNPKSEFDDNLLRSSNKVSLLTREQTPRLRTGINVEYKRKQNIFFYIKVSSNTCQHAELMLSAVRSIYYRLLLSGAYVCMYVRTYVFYRRMYVRTYVFYRCWPSLNVLFVELSGA